jgi:acetylornithine deacetylase
MLTAAARLAELVAYPTVSRDANAAMIAHVATALTEAGGAVRVLPGTAPGKQNLFATFGPAGDGGVILSGHSDVVPVDGQAFTADPFTLTRRGDRLLARGAVDMKGFIACAITAAATLDATKLRRPLHIALSHDEELGCLGVRPMLATLKAEGFRAAGVIVGEPTEMRIATGHKGKVNGCLHCRGAAAHSANPGLGCNAIYLAAGMIAELRDLQAWLAAHGARDAAYAVPYSTVHVGTIAGGRVVNIVPDECDVGFEIRYLPGDDIAALLARLRAAGDRLAGADTRAGITLSITNEYPGAQTPADAPLVKQARAAGAGALFKASFGSEAGLFAQELYMPTIVCGPGSIDRAHKADEFITIDELDECDRFLGEIIDGLGKD